jgi:hypothetical protein
MIARSPPLLLIGLVAALWLVARLLFVAGEEYVDGTGAPISLEEWLYPDMAMSVPVPSKLMPWNFPSVDMPPMDYAPPPVNGRAHPAGVQVAGTGGKWTAKTPALLLFDVHRAETLAAKNGLPPLSAMAMLAGGPGLAAGHGLAGGAGMASDTLPQQYRVMLAHLMSPTRLANRRAAFAMAAANGQGAHQRMDISATPPGMDGGAQRRRWLASLWAFYRPEGGSGNAAAATGAGAGTGPALLGGSQWGARVAVSVGRSGQAEGFARVASAGRNAHGVEGAVGVAVRPFSGVPIQVVAERRQRLAGQDGRSAFAAYAVGGVSDAPITAGWRIDGYGAAGIVGARQQDLFAQGQMRVTHDVIKLGGLRISGGAGGWAGAQRGAARADIGPTIDARLDNQRAQAGGLVGNTRLSIDWRQRVAGQAAPTSGIAITLGSDF